MANAPIADSERSERLSLLMANALITLIRGKLKNACDEFNEPVRVTPFVVIP